MSAEPVSPPEREFLTLPEVAALLGKSVKAVQHMRDRDQLPGLKRLTTRRFVVIRSELLASIKRSK